jgi:hypothetical protein
MDTTVAATIHKKYLNPTRPPPEDCYCEIDPEITEPMPKNPKPACSPPWSCEYETLRRRAAGSTKWSGKRILNGAQLIMVRRAFRAQETTTTTQKRELRLRNEYCRGSLPRESKRSIRLCPSGEREIWRLMPAAITPILRINSILANFHHKSLSISVTFWIGWIWAEYLDGRCGSRGRMREESEKGSVEELIGPSTNIIGTCLPVRLELQWPTSHPDVEGTSGLRKGKSYDFGMVNFGFQCILFIEGAGRDNLERFEIVQRGGSEFVVLIP